ncbi:uncharacterized protein LOC122281923 isoform X2 [Carya illinoinensis]|uniref:uncharacterized protein LOC122281923 isoform X2 n=1 Tax=Carya illinoinensis TaxID=32201 RepID=UPI001C724540|nr:uncharacterized protein LOC122281923 isoform X2 [Carya illinoinensis]
MAAKYSKNTTVLLLVTFAVLLDSDAVRGWGPLSKVEDLELDRRLKLINKPAIMSFQTEYGDIVDCVDIYKQLAFDHPLLKNHTIQLQEQMCIQTMCPTIYHAHMDRCPSGVRRKIC